MPTYSQSIRTTDAEVAEQQLKEVLAGLRIDPHPTRFAVELDTAGDERLATTRQRWSAAGGASIGAQSSIRITELVEGSLDARVGRQQMDTARPCLFPVAPASGTWNEFFEVRVTELDLVELTRFAHRRWGATTRLRFTGHAPIDDEMQLAWRHATAYARNLIVETPQVFANELIRVAAFELLADVCLRTFPNSTMDVDGRRPTAAATATVRRAVAYMEEHAGDAISLSDVAAAARVSDRTLHLAFVAATDVSPMRYLRRLRLEGVRADLQAAAADGNAAVGVIANRWGFAHLGRFAREYRTTFGEYPSQTRER